MKYTFALLCCLFVSSLARAERLVGYSAPEDAVQNTDFSVKVHIPGQVWQELPEYLIKVDEVRGIDHVRTNSYVSYFDLSDKVEVSVTSKRGNI